MIIYKFTNKINGDFYIGFTASKLENRKKPKSFSSEHRRKIGEASRLRQKNSSSTSCGSNL